MTVPFPSVCRARPVRRVVLTVLSAFLIAAPTAAIEARDMAPFDGYRAGTIVVRTSERKLYFVLGEGRALRYSVGVGKAGMQWSGVTRVSGKYVRPNWAPPADIKRANPRLPDLIPGGAPNNPMGAAALTLGDGDYAIHGTNRPETIGRFVSHGCIRMRNRDVLDLFERVSVGTPVVVTR